MHEETHFGIQGARFGSFKARVYFPSVVSRAGRFLAPIKLDPEPFSDQYSLVGTRCTRGSRRYDGRSGKGFCSYIHSTAAFHVFRSILIALSILGNCLLAS